MTSSTIRKAIGAVKDQTSIGIAKVAGNIAPDLEVLVVKATSHDDDPADEKYLREILHLTSYSRGYVTACVATVSRRLSKTRDWIVAIKALMLVHRLLIDGHPSFQEEIGVRVLNLAGFRDETHSHSWDHSAFVRAYALFLDEKVEVGLNESKLKGNDRNFDERDDFGYGRPRRSSSSGDFNKDSYDIEQRKETTPIRQMKPERVLEKLDQFLKLLDRILVCRPTGMAKNSRLVLVALYILVKETFVLYSNMCEALSVLLDQFTQMEYADCVQGFDMYVSSAKMIDQLVGFFGWCKDIGIARSSEFPAVQKITDQLLGTLEGFLKEMANKPSIMSPEKTTEENETVIEEPKMDKNEVKALPPPENYTRPPLEPQPQQVTQDLVNLRDDGVSAASQGSSMALALFSRPSAAYTTNEWEAFPENEKENWELALVETSSNLSNQKVALGGGMDPLLLNGMYDQGAVRQHVRTTELSGGSASSVVFPGSGKSTTSVLALLGPDGMVQPVGNQDPFAASLVIAPPSYVQIADMEKKQRLLVQEQQLWKQYGRDGMQGQAGLAHISNSSGYYGMPQVSGMGHPGYYHTPY